MGGTRISCEIIQAAKRLGCFVGVADYYPMSMSPGKQISDASYDVSTIDVDAMVSLIRSEHYDGMITGFSDMLLPYYAEICEKAGLPCYGTKEQFEIFSNKDRYKPLLRRFNIPTVEGYAIDPKNSDKSVQKIKWPILVKPADGSGARGISICSSDVEFKSAIEKAMNYSKTGKILVERYLSGREVTVNWLFKDGEAYLTSIANRHVKHNQDGVIPLPVGYTYPSSILSKYRREIEPKCIEMFKTLGIQNGMMFMQCKVVDVIPIVYDIGFRLTGTLEYKNINDICGYDQMDMMICFALTGNMGISDLAEKVDPTFCGRYGFNVSTLSAPGTISELKGVDEVKTIDGVIDSVIAHYPGETITEETKGLLAQITVRTLGTVDRKKDVYPIMKKIEDTIQIISSDGNRLNLSGIEPEDIEGFLL